jgi:hypothetical protein
MCSTGRTGKKKIRAAGAVRETFQSLPLQTEERRAIATNVAPWGRTGRSGAEGSHLPQPVRGDQSSLPLDRLVAPGERLR